MSLIFQMFVTNMANDYIFFGVENKLRNINQNSSLYCFGQICAAGLMANLAFEDYYSIHNLFNRSKRR